MLPSFRSTNKRSMTNGNYVPMTWHAIKYPPQGRNKLTQICFRNISAIKSPSCLLAPQGYLDMMTRYRFGRHQLFEIFTQPLPYCYSTRSKSPKREVRFPIPNQLTFQVRRGPCLLKTGCLIKGQRAMGYKIVFSCLNDENSFQHMTITGSIYAVLIIAVERERAILHPLKVITNTREEKLRQNLRFPR